MRSAWCGLFRVAGAWLWLERMWLQELLRALVSELHVGHGLGAQY